MKWYVGVREVHVRHVEIHAETEAEAIRKVKEGEGEEIFCEYSHTLDSSLWSAEHIATEEG